jgi:hypothetical protein
LSAASGARQLFDLTLKEFGAGTTLHTNARLLVGSGVPTPRAETGHDRSRLFPEHQHSKPSQRDKVGFALANPTSPALREGPEAPPEPVLGSPGEPNLRFIVGGDTAVLDSVRPVLEAISGGVHHLGPNGAGAVMKLIGNLLSAAQTAALGEGLALARKNGLAADGVIEVLDRFGGSSTVIRGAARKTLANDFAPAFHLKNMAKDIGLMLDLGKASQVPMPGTALTAELYRAAMAAGYGELQANAIHKVQFGLAGIKE